VGRHATAARSHRSGPPRPGPDSRQRPVLLHVAAAPPTVAGRPVPGARSAIALLLLSLGLVGIVALWTARDLRIPAGAARRSSDQAAQALPQLVDDGPAPPGQGSTSSPPGPAAGAAADPPPPAAAESVEHPPAAASSMADPTTANPTAELVVVQRPAESSSASVAAKPRNTEAAEESADSAQQDQGNRGPRVVRSAGVPPDDSARAPRSTGWPHSPKVRVAAGSPHTGPTDEDSHRGRSDEDEDQKSHHDHKSHHRHAAERADDNDGDDGD
jgi:hypothetical protein